ncbi:MAG: Gfo/Idh/MocA family protein, partial [Planctomycetota bacterium]
MHSTSNQATNANTTRRSFLKKTAAFATFLPGLSLADSPNSRLQHASIGVGGMGNSDLNAILRGGTTDIVAICDVDASNLAKAAQRLPNARKYRDWRELLEKEAENIDSVNVSTPDHMHAPISYSAIKLGKHVYCQKPLTHTVHEARQLTLAARKAKVVTQMGIQIHADISYRMAAAIIQQGAIGKIKEWHSWQGSGAWTAGGRPEGQDPIPANLDWDKWIGVAPMRPYKKDIYHPVRWRGWRDFGSGVMGDFACHIFDPVFTAIEVSHCKTVRAEVPKTDKETFPNWQIAHFTFPGTKYTAEDAIDGTWYNGPKRPSRDLVPMPPEYKLPGAGSIIIGHHGVMVLPHWAAPQLYPLEKFKGYKRPKIKSVDHYQQWVDACLGKGKAEADFDYSGPLTETAQLGNVAISFPNQTLNWNAKKFKITTIP